MADFTRAACTGSITASRLQQEHDSFDVRVRYSIPEQHAVLVNIGRLIQTERTSPFFSECFRMFRMPRYLLVGEGELGQELRASSSQHSECLTGFDSLANCLSERVAQAILRQADLFLLPSRYESFCLAAMEAMHHGLPVIASDLPCLREVIGNDQVFFPCDDEITLTNIVSRLLSSPRERDSMGIAGKARAMRFSAERMVGEYEWLMSEAMLYATRHIRQQRTIFGEVRYPW